MAVVPPVRVRNCCLKTAPGVRSRPMHHASRPTRPSLMIVVVLALCAACSEHAQPAAVQPEQEAAPRRPGCGSRPFVGPHLDRVHVTHVRAGCAVQLRSGRGERRQGDAARVLGSGFVAIDLGMPNLIEPGRVNQRLTDPVREGHSILRYSRSACSRARRWACPTRGSRCAGRCHSTCKTSRPSHGRDASSDTREQRSAAACRACRRAVSQLAARPRFTTMFSCLYVAL